MTRLLLTTVLLGLNLSAAPSAQSLSDVATTTKEQSAKSILEQADCDETQNADPAQALIDASNAARKKRLGAEVFLGADAGVDTAKFTAVYKAGEFVLAAQRIGVGYVPFQMQAKMAQDRATTKAEKALANRYMAASEKFTLGQLRAGSSLYGDEIQEAYDILAAARPIALGR